MTNKASQNTIFRIVECTCVSYMQILVNRRYFLASKRDVQITEQNASAISRMKKCKKSYYNSFRNSKDVASIHPSKIHFSSVCPFKVEGTVLLIIDSVTRQGETIRPGSMQLNSLYLEVCH